MPQLLAIYCGDQVEDFLKLTPWRKEKQITAGRVRLGLQMILGHVRVRPILNKSDSLDYIHSDAQRGMNALDETADEQIITAIKNGEIGDWSTFAILESPIFRGI